MQESVLAYHKEERKKHQKETKESIISIQDEKDTNTTVQKSKGKDNKRKMKRKN